MGHHMILTRGAVEAATCSLLGRRRQSLQQLLGTLKQSSEGSLRRRFGIVPIALMHMSRHLIMSGFHQSIAPGCLSHDQPPQGPALHSPLPWMICQIVDSRVVKRRKENIDFLGGSAGTSPAASTGQGTSLQ